MTGETGSCFEKPVRDGEPVRTVMVQIPDHKIIKIEVGKNTGLNWPIQVVPTNLVAFYMCNFPAKLIAKITQK